MPETLTRQWGEERIIAWTPTHAGKILIRKAGTRGGFQLHVKEESHYIYAGRLKLERLLANGTVDARIVDAGEGWTVAPGTVHREEAITDTVVFEVSDPTREDRYPIVPDPGGLPAMTDADATAKLVAYASQLRQRATACYALAQRIQDGGLASLVPAIRDEVRS